MTTATAHRRAGELIDRIAIERCLGGDDVALTPAETRVAVHAASALGWSKIAIARRLRIGEKTVNEHLDARPVLYYIPERAA